MEKIADDCGHNAKAPERHTTLCTPRAVSQRGSRRLSRTVNVYSITGPTVPIIIAKVIGVLDTPLSSSAAPLDIRMVVLALVVQVPDMVVRNAFGILRIYIASVLWTVGHYVCVGEC